MDNIERHFPRAVKYHRKRLGLSQESFAVKARIHRTYASSIERTKVQVSIAVASQRFNEKLGRALYRKNLHTDPATGAEIRLVRYPAGVINPLHTHPCGHGMYVLEGCLVTHKGSFGPGTFVWFPEGEVMEHGASPDGDATVLFITNKSFRIDYVD